jgi:hypothetical protein
MRTAWFGDGGKNIRCRRIRRERQSFGVLGVQHNYLGSGVEPGLEK